MTMLSFKQVESNYGKKEPCERGCGRIIKFSHCLNFGYCKYGVIIFSIQTQTGCTHCTHKEKKICKWAALVVFLRRVNLMLIFF